MIELPRLSNPEIDILMSPSALSPYLPTESQIKEQETKQNKKHLTRACHQ